MAEGVKLAVFFDKLLLLRIQPVAFALKVLYLKIKVFAFVRDARLFIAQFQQLFTQIRELRAALLELAVKTSLFFIPRLAFKARLFKPLVVFVPLFFYRLLSLLGLLDLFARQFVVFEGFFLFFRQCLSLPSLISVSLIFFTYRRDT